MWRTLEECACANQNKLALWGAVQLTTLGGTSTSVALPSDEHDSVCQDTFFILQTMSDIIRP